MEKICNLIIYWNTYRAKIYKEGVGFRLEVLIDGLNVANLSPTAYVDFSTNTQFKKIWVKEGLHTLCLRLHWDAVKEVYDPKAHDDTGYEYTPHVLDFTEQFIASENDVEYTINQYDFGNYSPCVEFLEGNIPMDPERTPPPPPPKSGGCYVATCVYGSYDCPEVWTLRRYRDDTLGASWYGRLFVRVYYAVSPTLVKWFGETRWFKRLWRGKLDRMIKKLQDKGVESTPYKDKIW